MPVLDQPDIPALALRQAGVRLGPAVVTDPAGDRITVVFEGQALPARLALAFAYAPLAGDLVLVIIQEVDAYIIGVLSGRGPTTVTAHGDLTLAAPHGRVLIQAGQGVEVAAPQVAVQAQVITMTAVSLVQRLQTAFQSVTDLLHITAGQRQTRIEGVSMESTGRSYHRADKEIVLNGESVNIT